MKLLQRGSITLLINWLIRLYCLLSGTDKLKEWVALKGEGDQAPKIRTARSVTAMPYEGTRKRRRAAIGDHNWKIGDRVDTWVHDR